jgi:hypothetical protein
MSRSADLANRKGDHKVQPSQQGQTEVVLERQSTTRAPSEHHQSTPRAPSEHHQSTIRAPARRTSKWSLNVFASHTMRLVTDRRDSLFLRKEVKLKASVVGAVGQCHAGDRGGRMHLLARLRFVGGWVREFACTPGVYPGSCRSSDFPRGPPKV